MPKGPKRSTLISIHLILAALFLPLMLILPLSGSAYIFGWHGSATTEELVVLNEAMPEDEAEREAFFREVFAEHAPGYDFAYMRGRGNSVMFRPTTRTYYTAETRDDGTTLVERVRPSLLKRLIELHKGHGPRLMRWFEGAFGVALIFTALSGLWLAWTVKKYRKQTIIAFVIGSVAMVLCLV